jgi:uncharacterized membrane-anchored protein YhcB (DUF1043 family)
MFPGVLMRWLHFASMATLVGGMIYGRLVMSSSLTTLAPDAQKAFDIALDHLETQLRRYAKRLKNHHDRGGQPSPSGPA